MSYYNKGFHWLQLPTHKGTWQFTLLAIGRDEDDNDHETFPVITYYMQFMFWQFGYTYEKEKS